ncbi:uncharacterized protein LTR77_006107 [Saxophila tyrrhenica]|uniref:Uncharacterized protein n=1 Tax=Saxophila tyrrhenica TaxID=1690608 RepID=A0AAV9P7T2_9PEZI|nr:hypothetical protein LTR77_006107 [Saxophila tyrrhenica]
MASADLPGISISRSSSDSDKVKEGSSDASQSRRPTPTVDTNAKNSGPWHRKRSALSAKSGHDIVKWKIKWTPDCFPTGRVLIVDYISNTASGSSAGSGKRHITIEAQEFEDISGLKKFYSNTERVHAAALRVIHVQNASWATDCLLSKYNVDHQDEVVGMPGFSKWARYEKPRQRGGRPFPDGRSWREQTDPWRNISRTAFGLDYLKTYRTPPADRQHRATVLSDKEIDAKMMHLDAWSDSSNPQGYDVSVQRMSVYVQRHLGPPGRLSPDQDVRNPYTNLHFNDSQKPGGRTKTEFDRLDNTNTVIIFETSASMLLNDCLIQPRNDFEKRWRRLSFYLKREDVTDDHRLAAQCTRMILEDVFHGLAIIWQEFLSVGTDHVSMLEDKIYENPADESRAPDLWTNQSAWLKVDKVMWMHQDLIREVAAHMHEVAEVEVEDHDPIQVEWLSSIPAEYDRLAHSVSEDLVQPTANLSDLMYKSVGIRDSRQSLQLGLSMWRLSWITFIFLPLTFLVSFFGMNVNIFAGDDEGLPDVAWYFLAASILMLFVLLLWYCVKHSLQRRRQTPYQRGLYERLFNDLEGQHPLLWSSSGASNDAEPLHFTDKLKWRLLRRWFAPEKTINKQLYSNIAGGDDSDLGAWARFKRRLLSRWLPTIRLRYKPGDTVPLSELTSHDDGPEQTHSAPPSLLKYQPTTINALAKVTTPIAVADAEPTAVQQMATAGLQPMGLQGRKESRRTSSAPASPRISEERPGSRGSSGIMIEERNLSDDDSDAAEGAVVEHNTMVDQG